MSREKVNAQFDSGDIEQTSMLLLLLLLLPGLFSPFGFPKVVEKQKIITRPTTVIFIAISSMLFWRTEERLSNPTYELFRAIHLYR